MTAVLSEFISKPARAWAFLTQVYMTMAQGDVAWQKGEEGAAEVHGAGGRARGKRAQTGRAEGARAHAGGTLLGAAAAGAGRLRVRALHSMPMAMGAPGERASKKVRRKSKPRLRLPTARQERDSNSRVS